MAKYTFDHIHHFTRDPEGVAKWYENTFGAEVIRTMPQGKPRVDVKLGGCNIFILDVSGDPKATTEAAHPLRRREPQSPPRVISHAAHIDWRPTATEFVRGKQARPLPIDFPLEKSRRRPDHHARPGGNLKHRTVLAQSVIEHSVWFQSAARVFKQALISGDVNPFVNADRIEFHS